MSTYRLFGVAFAIATAASLGCHKQPTTVERPTTASYSYKPQLVAVDNGVWVMADSDVPIYYVDDYYYTHRYKDNRWLRSTSAAGGWMSVDIDRVPPEIANRDHRWYIHYRPGPNVQTRDAPNVDVGESDPGLRTR